MKLASIVSSVLLGASVATACGGIETISNPLGAGDAGGSAEPPQQGSSGSSAGGAPGAAPADAGMPAVNISCQGTRSCPRSQVCCATLSFGTGTGGFDVACARSCAPGAYQICATSAECTTSGDVCTPSPLVSYCAAAGTAGARGGPDAGAVVDGSAHDASFPLDGEVTIDAGSNDSAIVDATGLDASGVDATVDASGVDATVDATGVDATGVATSPDATGLDAPGDDSADDGSADDDSSD
jgi:hypothetical protein